MEIVLYLHGRNRTRKLKERKKKACRGSVEVWSVNFEWYYKMYLRVHKCFKVQVSGVFTILKQNITGGINSYGRK